MTNDPYLFQIMYSDSKDTVLSSGPGSEDACTIGDKSKDRDWLSSTMYMALYIAILYWCGVDVVIVGS